MLVSVKGCSSPSTLFLVSITCTSSSSASFQRSGENVKNIHGANLGFVEARDGARNGHIGTAMNRTTWWVRDNGFHTIVTRLVRDGTGYLYEVLVRCLGCHEVGLSM
jgi:hypothetical protein